MTTTGEWNPQLEKDYGKILELVMTHARAVVMSGEHLVPIAAAIRIDGECEASAAMPDPSSEFGNSEEVERMLIAGLRKDVKLGKYRTTGIAIEMRELRREGRATVPAIKVILESKLGLPIYLYQPFQRRSFLKPRLEDWFTVPGSAVVFDDNLDVS